MTSPLVDNSGRLTRHGRHIAMIEAVRASPGISVSLLADFLGVSPRTVLAYVTDTPGLADLFGLSLVMQPVREVEPADPCGNVVPITTRRKST